MDRHPSSESTSAFNSIFKMKKGTFATPRVVTISRNENARTEWDVTQVINVKKLTSGKMTYESTLSLLPSPLQSFMNKHTGLNFFPSLYSKLLSQLAEPHVDVLMEPWKISNDLTKQTNKEISSSNWMDQIFSSKTSHCDHTKETIDLPPLWHYEFWLTITAFLLKFNFISFLAVCAVLLSIMSNCLRFGAIFYPIAKLSTKPERSAGYGF